MPDERDDPRPVARFTYKNHKGEIANRSVAVDAIEYITSPGYDYGPGWFISGYCYDRKARRSFAFANVVINPADRTHRILRFDI